MTLNQLKCFVHVAELHNFSEAARQLNLAQSAVSYHIAELEKELDVKLFVRIQKDVMLTSEGKALLDKAYEVLSITSGAPLLVKKAATGTSGIIKIGVPFPPLLDRYVMLFREFKEKYPEVEIRINTCSSTEISRQLESNQLDIGFTRYPFLYNKQLLKWEPLYTEPLYVVINKMHPLSRKKQVRITDFKDDIMLLNQRHCDPGWFDLVMNACAREQFSPLLDDQYTDLLVVMLLIEIGAGFTVLPACWKNHVSEELCFLEIKESGIDKTETVGIAWSKKSHNSSISLLLKEFGVPIKE